MGFAVLIVAAAILAQLSTPAQPADGATRYFEVPLQGEVGKEITAPGMRDAIRAAVAKKADCIVFVIDTPGGRVADAAAIATVMDRERSGLKYYAVINRAISAAVWPLSRMDGIFFTPGAAAGAAVAFSISRQTGSAEVDAKMNAALTAEVSAAAETHGQSGSVYRAMMIQSYSLYRWKTGSGAVALGEAAPRDAKDVVQLDNESSVLAWTAKQAAESGFGKLMPSKDLASLGPLLNIEKWSTAGNGTVQMTKAFRDIERIVKQIDTAKNQITTSRDKVASSAQNLAGQVNTARAADPKRMQFYYSGSGTLTPDSQVKWRTQSDIAIDAWNAVIATAEDVQRYQRKAAAGVDDLNKAAAAEVAARLYPEKYEPLKLDPVNHGLDINAIGREASSTLARIRSERSKSRV